MKWFLITAVVTFLVMITLIVFVVSRRKNTISTQNTTTTSEGATDKPKVGRINHTGVILLFFLDHWLGKTVVVLVLVLLGFLMYDPDIMFRLYAKCVKYIPPFGLFVGFLTFSRFARTEALNHMRTTGIWWVYFFALVIFGVLTVVKILEVLQIHL